MSNENSRSKGKEREHEVLRQLQAVQYGSGVRNVWSSGRRKAKWNRKLNPITRQYRFLEYQLYANMVLFTTIWPMLRAAPSTQEGCTDLLSDLATELLSVHSTEELYWGPLPPLQSGKLITPGS